MVTLTVITVTIIIIIRHNHNTYAIMHTVSSYIKLNAYC
jgi:hypothetical protein